MKKRYTTTELNQFIAAAKDIVKTLSSPAVIESLEKAIADLQFEIDVIRYL